MQQWCILWGLLAIEILKEQNLFEIEIFCKILNVFTVNFNQCTLAE